MNNYFELKIKYQKIDETGKEVVAVQNLITEAVSFTDVEAKVYEQLRELISGDIEIVSIKRSAYSEYHFNESFDYFFGVSVSFISIDEKSGKQKKHTSKILVQEETAEGAALETRKLWGDVSDIEINSVRRTNIEDIV